MSGPAARHVWVYAAARREETYVYLPAEDSRGVLPAELADALGALRLVTDFDLDAGRTLARTDGASVLRGIDERGYFLQLAPHPANGREQPN